MSQLLERSRSRCVRGDGGFSLVELLVVILIVAILAAIAIPVFLNQRKKGWAAQVQSAVKNMATAEESYLVDHPSYTTSLAALANEGFTYSAVDVDPSVVSATANRFCLKVVSKHDTSITYYYDSDVGAPYNQTAPCS
jgi:type IV pilus assembly protein PilA